MAQLCLLRLGHFFGLSLAGAAPDLPGESHDLRRGEPLVRRPLPLCARELRGGEGVPAATTIWLGELRGLSAARRRAESYRRSAMRDASDSSASSAATCFIGSGITHAGIGRAPRRKPLPSLPPSLPLASTVCLASAGGGNGGGDGGGTGGGGDGGGTGGGTTTTACCHASYCS